MWFVYQRGEIMGELCNLYFPNERSGKAYKNEEEYYSDRYRFLDMCIASVGLLITKEQTDDEKEKSQEQKRRHLQEIPGSLTEAYDSVLGKAEDVSEDTRKYVKDELRRAQWYIKERLAYTPNNGRSFKMRMLSLELELTKLEDFLLLLAWANSYDEKYEKIFADMQGRMELNHPTFQLALFLFGLFSKVDETEVGRLLQKQSILPEYFFDIKKEVEGKPKTYSFALNKRAVSFFYGYDGLDSDVKMFAQYMDTQKELPEIYIRQDVYKRVEKSLYYHAREQGEYGHVLHVYGPRGNGKKLFLSHGAKAAGCGIIFVDLEKIELLKLDEIGRLVSKLIQESILLSAILCIEDKNNRAETEEGKENSHGGISYFIRLLSEKTRFFMWVSQEKSRYLLEHPIHLQCMEMPLLTVNERIVLWEQFSKDYCLSKDINLTMCANQFILSADKIKEVLKTANFIRIEQEREEIIQNDIRMAVKQQSPNQLGRFATLINSVYTWEDLVVSKEQEHQMRMICNQLKYRNIVGEEWGFFKKTAYGRGICALLYGSPGTGKTMAVQVMANELGLDLYRVDLSQMVSKYIGETEKNISELFKKAKNINALLFFDEADSMFAKRSEVKDSHDRNANAQTAHLLQKLEDYEGIAILATNYVNNIDDAFKRRIKFMINFSFPTPQVRLQLWNAILPPAVPCEEELDFEFYAEHFELSGSNIKEILTNASFIAASEGGELANRHIIEAIKLNFSKYGKILTDEDFGYLI